jgi:hypothetical protein
MARYRSKGEDLAVAARDWSWQALCEARAARTSELQKLDNMERAIWHAWEGKDCPPGNLACMRELLRCTQQRMALLRLDRPAPTPVTAAECDQALREIVVRAPIEVPAHGRCAGREEIEGTRDYFALGAPSRCYMCPSREDGQACESCSWRPGQEKCAAAPSDLPGANSAAGGQSAAA